MKLFFKTALLTVIAASLHVTQALAAETPKSTESTDVDSANTINSHFKNDDQQSGYALGASISRYMENSLKEQEKLGIKLDKDQLIAGLQDTFANKSHLTNDEVDNTLKRLEARLKTAAQARMEEEAQKNTDEGDKYRATFAQESGVKKTQSGLLYKIEKPGTGKIPKDSDTVVVNYKGTLIDGTEFDNSYTRGEPLSFRLGGVIPGWQEGLKHLKKGGKITLVIPPDLAYGKTGMPGIPPNSTLIFDVELLEIKGVSKTNVKAEKSAGADTKVQGQ